MSKPRIDKEQPGVVLRYANWLAQFVAMIKPTNLFLILGRATGKTVSVLAYRFKDMSKEMPGAFISISADTYMNAVKNIIPNIIEGWQKLGWVEGIHFVVDEKPPPHFKKPHKTVLSWKHTLTTHHGTHFKIISQDRPSSGAGDSYQADGGDEAKYLNKKKLNKIQQATRGEFIRYKDSPYYGGSTYTTDMPNTNLGEHDWILDMADNMNDEQIKLMYQTANVVNEIRIELVKIQAKIKQDLTNNELRKEEALIKKNLKRWEVKFNKIRKDSTFFFVGSSYINADILTESYFVKQFEKGNFKELMVALLSLQPKLEKGLMFYPNLSEANFFSDGTVYNRTDAMSYHEIQEDNGSSLDLKYINHDAHLEAGFDSGNMCTLVVGQEQLPFYRMLKEFYTLPPEFIPELGRQFREYFKYHKNKQLLLYHDRATNKYKSVGEDHASKLKKAIEYDDDGNKVWTVQLMNEEQAVIYQQEEYELCLEMMSGKNKELPFLLIDKHNCPCLKSSLEKAQKIIKVKDDGSKSIHKDKSSEKLPAERLPLESTNPSDSGKYLWCRPEYLDKISGETSYFSADPIIK